MKVRTDFVSNSSSSSFVFSADFRKYPFELFIKDVCARCQCEDKAVDLENMSMLSYCLRKYELLHLGYVVGERKREIVRRGYDGIRKITDPNELAFSEFEVLKREIGAEREYDNLERPSIKLLSEDELEYEYDVLMPNGITVTHDYMSDIIRARSYLEKNSVKKRADEIFRTIKYAEGLHHLWKTPFLSETYLVTKNTVSNTKDLIATGYEIRDTWSWKIDEMEARLDAGETIFHTVCADAGEGGGDTRLFSEGIRYPFDGLPLEPMPE